MKWLDRLFDLFWGWLAVAWVTAWAYYAANWRYFADKIGP